MSYPPVSSVMEAILRGVEEHCGAFTTGTQSATCTVLADKCSRMNVKCGNEAVQTFVCYDKTSLIEAAVNAAYLSGPDLFLDTTKDKMASKVKDTCAGGLVADASVILDLICDESNGALVEALNRVDQSTMCTALAVCDLYLKALGNAKTLPYVPPKTQDSPTAAATQGQVIGAFVAVAVVLALIVLVPSSLALVDRVAKRAP
jgi:hypothetical protein